MAKPRAIITYNDVHAKALCRLIYFGPDEPAEGEAPAYAHRFVTEAWTKNATGEEGFHEARSRVPQEVVFAQVCVELASKDLKGKVVDGVMFIDATKLEFPV